MMLKSSIRSDIGRVLIVLCIFQQLSACSSDDAVPIGTGSVSVAWSKPEYREDSAILSVGEISGYRVYYGPGSGDYQREVDIANDGSPNGVVTVADLPRGKTYYFVLTAYDTEGRESLYSPEIAIPL